MRPALSGLQDGLLSRGGLLMLTWSWTLTLISPTMRRQKSPFPLTALESRPPQLRPAPLLRLLLLILHPTSEPPCTILHFFFTLGSEPRIYVMSFGALKLNEYLIFYLVFFFHNCIPYAPLHELTWIGGYMALFEQLISSKTELLSLRELICLS